MQMEDGFFFFFPFSWSFSFFFRFFPGDVMWTTRASPAFFFRVAIGPSGSFPLFMSGDFFFSVVVSGFALFFSRFDLG